MTFVTNGLHVILPFYISVYLHLLIATKYRVIKIFYWKLISYFFKFSRDISEMTSLKTLGSVMGVKFR